MRVNRHPVARLQLGEHALQLLAIDGGAASGVLENRIASRRLQLGQLDVKGPPGRTDAACPTRRFLATTFDHIFCAS